MDAVKFIKERKRLCNMYPCCSECPARGKDRGCRLSITSEEEAEKQIELIEEWSAAHPCKTRQSVFLEQWPEAEIAKNGVVAIAPCSLLETYRKGRLEAGKCGALETRCDDCRREFWMQEVE